MEDREPLFSHTPVLLSECISALDVRDGLTYVDCTTGGGGHSEEIARRLGKNGRLICLDRDTDALTAAVGAMGIDTSGRNVLIAHQFVTGAERSESEDVSVGGMDNVDVS
ncbi:MAG: 16S rRNA (cytosine(1402)-N(4))-methyltransferase, partial [Clostridia bacterium]|nr:16S rRNA (cytosine(1402)-N(4))-methyltransferase [Clostridia bacterium]